MPKAAGRHLLLLEPWGRRKRFVLVFLQKEGYFASQSPTWGESPIKTHFFRKSHGHIVKFTGTGKNMRFGSATGQGPTVPARAIAGHIEKGARERLEAMAAKHGAFLSSAKASRLECQSPLARA